MKVLLLSVKKFMMFHQKQTLLPLFMLLFIVLACGFWKREPTSGSEFLIKVECSEADCERFVKQTIGVLRIRADALGLSYKVEPKGKDEIVVRIGAMQDPERIKSVLFSYNRLELLAVVSPPSPSPVQTYQTPDEAKNAVKEGEDILPYADFREEKKYVIVKAKPIVANEDIRDAQAYSSDGTVYQINFSLKPDGAQRFGEWTAANINQYLAVALNREVKSIPYIKSQIRDSGQITGSYTKASAEDLALTLRSGSLPAPIKLLEEKTFGK